MYVHWDYVYYQVVSVIVQVTSITLQNPPASGSHLTVNEGTSTSLVCVTNACRPSASVLWYIGETNYTLSSTPFISDVTGNLHITTSTLTFNPNRTTNKDKVKCSAYNYGDDVITANNQPKLNVRCKYLRRKQINVVFPLPLLTKIGSVGQNLFFFDQIFL